MTAKWGVFLCNCHQSRPIDLHQLDLPTPFVLMASHTAPDVHALAELAQRERLDRVLISCGASPTRFEDALGAMGAPSPTLHFVNLHEQCFQVHPVEQAHAKARRLIRAVMQSAEAQIAPAYNPLSAGGRILIAGDPSAATHLAQQLRDVAQPFGVMATETSVHDLTALTRIYPGHVVDVKGRLGDFRVRVEEAASPDTAPRAFEADQVVLITADGAPAVHPRTGWYLLSHPSPEDLEALAVRIRDLIGDFLKVVHVRYDAGVCAGGAADQEACGHCITACPYEAVRRDAHNHLRMQVDHMACEGCGACVAACPTSALQFTGPSPRELDTRLTALLSPPPTSYDAEPPVILFRCGEQGRRTLAEAGRLGRQYPANVLPVEVPCLRYVSDANMLAAFHLGAAGVGLLGCATCAHGERDLLYQNMEVCRLTLDAFGMGAARLRLMTTAEGAELESLADLTHFAETALPVTWHGQPLPETGGRDVMAAAIASFIRQTGSEPGRRVLDAAHPFALAEVQETGCTMCRACVQVCPTHAFRYEEHSASLQYKQIDCIACGLCETVCPEHVITLQPEMAFTQAALAHRTVVQDAMVACAQCGKLYINRKALEAIEAKVLSLESVLDALTDTRRSLLRMCPDCRAVAAMKEVEKGWEP